MPVMEANASRFIFGVDGVEFLVVEFKATESMSKPFLVEMSLASEDDIQLDDMIGKEGLLKIVGTENRYFHGVINEFRQSEIKGRFYLYHASLVPTLWQLSLRRDSRIFQQKSVPDIVKQVLADASIFQDRVIFRLRNKYPEREYCVQYQESDLNFISRLLEEEGIFYLFGHKEDKHMLIFGDDAEICWPISDAPEISYHIADSLVADEQFVYVFDSVRQLHSDQIVLTDYNFKKPALDLTSFQKESDKSTLGLFDYPGNFFDVDAGRNRAQVRLQEATALKFFAEGRSNCAWMAAGHKFTLANHDRSELDREYLLVDVRHSGSQPQVLGELAATDEGFEYNNALRVIPATVTYRPPRTTPKAIINGIQSAIVMGPKNEEIYTDKYGRIKVKFHWDHATEADGAKIEDEKRSCWIRVVQSVAGPGWGTVFLPRVGHEVIVNFLEGDPDRPIVTGQVYHGTHNQPYTLPDDKTRSVIKTNSSPDGGGFNEIRFEDKKENEQIFMHAQKDFEIRILNDHIAWIGNEDHTIIAKDKLEKIEGDRHLTVTGDQNEKTGGALSIEIGSDLQAKVGDKYGLDASSEIHLKAGMKFILEAGTQISLKAGGSFIDIGPGGVSIKGAMVNINSGGSAGSGSGVSAETPLLPREADTAQSGMTAQVETTQQVPLSPQAESFKQAAKSGTPFCETCPS